MCTPRFVSARSIAQIRCSVSTSTMRCGVIGRMWGSRAHARFAVSGEKLGRSNRRHDQDSRAHAHQSRSRRSRRFAPLLRADVRKEYYRDADSIQALGPGPHDVLAFVRSRKAGRDGGISHFGFRLVDPHDIDDAVRTAKRAGAKILDRGEFSPGFPYLYVADPDGYVIEIWYE